MIKHTYGWILPLVWMVTGFPTWVSAQNYPTRSVRFIIPFAAGGTIDVIGRLVGPSMSKNLGQAMVVENRPGGGTVIACEIVAHAPADAYTILLMGPSYTINLFARPLPYDTERDFTTIARLAANPLLMSVHPSLPVKSPKELIALARSKPGELTYATASPTGFQRLAAEQFKRLAGIDIVNIPYQGGAPATIAVLGGHTTILLGNLSEATPFVASGKLRAIAVTSLERSDFLKEVPTLNESGYAGYEATNWFGAVTRAGAPKAAIERLSVEFKRALETQEAKAGLHKNGLYNAYMNVEKFDVFLNQQFRANEKTVKSTGMRME